MDAEQKEQAFDAIYMAIQHGHISSARRAFDRFLERAYTEKMNHPGF